MVVNVDDIVVVVDGVAGEEEGLAEDESVTGAVQSPSPLVGLHGVVAMSWW